MEIMLSSSYITCDVDRNWRSFDGWKFATFSTTECDNKSRTLSPQPSPLIRGNKQLLHQLLPLAMFYYLVFLSLNRSKLILWH